MSELDEAMSDQINHIVHSEDRPFSYLDFLSFEQNGKQYSMKHGTFRNKISKRKKLNQVEVCYHDFLTFYTLKGVRFAKPMTADHRVVHNDPIYRMLQNLPLNKQSIHDIRLRFKISNIWKLFSTYTNFFKIKRSNDIRIPTWIEDNAILMITIHKTDVVSVIVSCSVNPIPLDICGIANFFALLVRVEESLRNKIHNIMHDYSLIYNYKNDYFIPSYRTWTITMWHFGRDGLTEYTGERFCITVENALGILTRIYSKDMKNRKGRIRIERQEYPKKSVELAIQEKIYGATI